MHTTLYDADTTEDLGPATPEQIEASTNEATGTGVILIDADGDVVRAGAFGSQDVRRVYTA